MPPMPPIPGLSRFGGGATVPPRQVGFPAKITSSYSSSTGYSWERLVLDLPTGAVAASSIPETGLYAFAVDGSTTIPLNTKVWLEPDANAQGYTFTTGAATLGTSSISFTFVKSVTCDSTGLHVTTKTATIGWDGTGLTYSET